MTRLAKPEITITVVQESTTFGYNGRRRGSLVTADGHGFARLGEAYYKLCGYCGGTGYRHEYRGIDGGRCYYCGASGLDQKVGRGSPEDIVKILKRRAADKARRDTLRETRAQAKWEAERAARTAWAETNPEVAAMIAAVCASRSEVDGSSPFSPVLVDICVKNELFIPTPNQVAAIGRMYPREVDRIAEKAAQTAARTWIGEVGGKVTFTGRLIYCQDFPTDFHGTFTIMRWVTEDGNSISWKRSGFHFEETGTVMTVTATVKEHKDSQKHGRETVVFRGKVATQAA